MAATVIIETVEGIVERTNDNGFQLAGRQGWLNLSRYAQPRPEIPSTGQRVITGLDRAGYVRSVDPAPEQPQAPNAANSDLPSPLAGEGPGMRGDPTPAGPPDRDTRIMRQAVLNTATAILASGGRATDTTSVLEFAAQLESWVSR